jgi:hypothetical protein
VTTIINVVLSVIFGKKYGLVGIISATVIARMIYAWWKEPIVIFNNYFKKTAKVYFVKYMLRIVYMGVILILINNISSSITIANLYLDFIMKVAVTLIISIVLLIMPYLNNDAIIYLSRIIKGDKNV